MSCGLDKLSRLELALRDRVLALSRVNVHRHLQQIMRQHNERVGGIDADPASAGQAEVEAAPPELALDLEERVKVGLVTLCSREKELYLEQFEQQILSRRMVAMLAARADRLIDTVRDRGEEGYEAWLRDIVAARRRPSAWRCGCSGGSADRRLLTERLADRFEILMVSQSVLAELAAFNVSSIADLLGADAEAKLAAVIEERQEGVEARSRPCRCNIPATPNRSRRASSSAPRSASKRRSMPGACMRASSAARSTTTCASSSTGGAAPSASVRRSISACELTR